VYVVCVCSITRRRVSDVPAPTAIRRVPHDIESTVNEGEGVNVADLRESRHRDETVRSGPSEHTIVSTGIEPALLLYVGSYVARRGKGVGMLGCGALGEGGAVGG